MFKRGGSSYEAQGTGITSPYDRPRKRYADGPTWEEIKERRSNIFQPRSEMDFAAEGFSALGNPYHERTGEAKTIGEMLYEGATGVRKSRAADKALGQGVELANIESDAARLLADELQQDKLEQIAAQNTGKGTYPDMHPGKLYDQRLSDWKRWLIANEGRAGHIVVDKNLSSFAAADIVIRSVILKAYDQGKKSIAEAVAPSAFKDNGEVDIKLLSGGVVYYNPVSKEWFTVNNPGTESAAPIMAKSYEEAWNNVGAPASKKESSDDLAKPDETKKKVVSWETEVEQEKFKDVTKYTEEYLRERFDTYVQGIRNKQSIAKQAGTGAQAMGSLSAEDTVFWKNYQDDPERAYQRWKNKITSFGKKQKKQKKLSEKIGVDIKYGIKKSGRRTYEKHKKHR